MASFSEHGVEIGTGILHPKMTHRFVVAYRASLRKGQRMTDPDRLAAGLKAFSMQTVSVKLPQIALAAPVGGSANELGFTRFTPNSQVEFVLQDDVQSIVLQTILSLPAVETFSAIVMKTDGDDNVIDAWELRDIIVRSFEHCELHYAPGQGAVNGNFEHPETDDGRGNPLRSRISLQISNNSFGADVVEFRLKGDVAAMLVCPNSGRTVQELMELL